MRRFKIIEHNRYSRNSYDSNSLFMSIFNDSPDAVFILDPYDFQILDCNKKAIELFQAVDKDDFSNLQSFSLYGSEPVEFSKQNFILETQKGKEYVQELNFKTFNNNIFWGRLIQKLIKVEGNKLVVLRINKIIDYNRTSEVLDTLIKHTSRETGRSFFKILTRLLASAFEARYVMVAKLKEDKVSSAESVEFYSGNAPAENFTFNMNNSPFSNLMNGYITYYPNNLKEMFPGYQLIDDLGIESFLGAPVFDRDGIVKGMLVIMDDKPMHEKLNSRNILSVFAARTGAEMERIIEEDELRSRVEELNKTNTTKEKLLQIIAHDLKNPFHTIQGYCDLLRKKIDTYDKSKITEFVNIIDLSVRSNYTLLENLTEWSKVQHEIIQFSPEKVDLYNVILDASELFYLAAERKGISLANKVPQDTAIMADMNMLRTIIRNLVSNAIKFSEPDTEVTISAEHKDKEFIISVCDAGVGMSEEMVREKLEENSCSSTAGTDNEKGTGIGLFICKDFISRHGGKLMIKSKPGKGTTISFTIPQ